MKQLELTCDHTRRRRTRNAVAPVPNTKGMVNRRALRLDAPAPRIVDHSIVYGDWERGWATVLSEATDSPARRCTAATLSIDVSMDSGCATTPRR